MKRVHECKSSVERDAEVGVRISDEAVPHSFIVKIWVEERGVDDGTTRWRGHITDVPSGRRVYIESLQEIPLFVASYLEEMKVRFGLGWRLWRWLFRKRR